MNLIKVVGYEKDTLKEKASLLAEALNFELDKEANPSLFVAEQGLSLKILGFSPLYADFSASVWNKRRSEGKKQGLVRACHPKNNLKIIDATAGWGRDAAVLACFGAQVLMLERDVVMASLLADALLRMEERDKDQMKLSLEVCEASDYLNKLTKEEYPDIIYIDPMHPQRNKSALVKKDMQALQQMIGADTDALELIQLAITRVKQRVVVKWPQKLKSLTPADAAIVGKTVRFDIYFPD